VLAFRPADVAGDGLILGAGNLVVLEPEKWVGRRWPLLEYVDQRAELSVGRWQVVLYHHECPRCQAVLERLADVRGHLALVEVPPHGGPPANAPPGAHLARLSETREWFVETPLVLTLRDGIVEGVSSRFDGPTTVGGPEGPPN
jgi:hypothetical protein